MNDRFESIKHHYLDEMRIQLNRIKDIAEKSLERMEQKGTDGYYSTNHDVLDAAFRTYRASKALGVLKQLDDDIQEMLVPTRGGAEMVDPFELPPPEEAHAVDVEKQD